MADITYTNTHAPRRSTFSGILHAIGDFFTMIGESNWRVREAERLQSMSDAQLAARGIRREDIARFVFRDTFSL